MLDFRLMEVLAAELPTAFFNFCFLYPLFMSWVWVTGSIYYWIRYERLDSDPTVPNQLDRFPKIALLEVG